MSEHDWATKRRMCGCLGDHCTHDEMLCRCVGCQLEAIAEMDATPAPVVARPAPQTEGDRDGE